MTAEKVKKMIKNNLNQEEIKTKENTTTQQTRTEKLDRLIEAGSNPARSTP